MLSLHVSRNKKKVFRATVTIEHPQTVNNATNVNNNQQHCQNNQNSHLRNVPIYMENGVGTTTTDNHASRQSPVKMVRRPSRPQRRSQSTHSSYRNVLPTTTNGEFVNNLNRRTLYENAGMCEHMDY